MDPKKRIKYRVLKLRDGTDIVGRVVGIDKEGVIIDTPMVYEMTPIFDAKGKIKYFTISFRKWFEFAKTQRYYFPKDFIVAESDPENDLIRDYVRARKANITFQKIKDNIEDITSEMKLDSVSMDDIMNNIVEDLVRGTGTFPEDSANFMEFPNSATASDGISDDFWRGFPLL
jgi:hypothetical protein